MKLHPLKALLLVCACTCFSLPAAAADRVRAGQWETTLSMNGQMMTRSTCISPSDAEAINGDAQSIRAYVEKVSAPAACRVTDIQIHGNQVIATTICASGKENVGTTTYHGDSSETTNTNGAQAHAKWLGACK